MKCHVCGSTMTEITTDLPFKVSNTAIVIVKQLPVVDCSNCHEYLLADPIMERVEQMFANLDARAELEIIRYAA